LSYRGHLKKSRAFHRITVGKKEQLYLKQYKLQYDDQIIEINSTEDKRIESIKGLFDKKELEKFNEAFTYLIKDEEIKKYMLFEKYSKELQSNPLRYLLTTIKKSLNIHKFFSLIDRPYMSEFEYLLFRLRRYKLPRKRESSREKKKFIDAKKIEIIEKYLDRVRKFRTGLDRIHPELSDTFTNLFYIGPLRTYPQRYYPISGEIPIDVGFRGEKAIDVIVSYSKESKEVLKKVNEWIKKFELGSKVSPKEAEEFHIAALNILHSKIKKSKRRKLDVNITNMGFGTCQVLPIIIEGFYAPRNSMIMIEQPEVHLHPKMQADLADVLIDITKSNKRLIIETHSEHLISRLQRRIAEGGIAEGKITAENVKIYYFEMTESGTRIRKMDLDKYGRLEEWPQGFFEEGLNEAYLYSLAIGKLQKEEKENGK